MINLRLGAALAATVSALAFAAPAAAATCEVGGATLTIGSTSYTSTSCRDVNLANNSNPATELGALQTAFGVSGYSFLAKTGSNDNGGLAGIDFDVSAVGTKVGGDSKGTWGVTWNDVEQDPDYLPGYFDFIVYLKGSTRGAGYLFDQVLLSTLMGEGNGTFDIAFTNNGGNEPDLSHLSLFGSYGGSYTPPGDGGTDPDNDVPEPAALGLLGLGVLGLAAARRRRA